jgi:hypothetical protein
MKKIGGLGPEYNAQVPTIAIDSNGKIHIVWHGHDPANPSLGLQQMIYQSSSDGGNTWTSGYNLAALLGANGHGHPRIKIDSNNYLYVVWDKAGTGIAFAKSTDHGLTWTAKWIQGVGVAGFNPSLACHKPDIAIGPGGVIHVTYVDNGGHLGDIYYRSSSDGGTTWTDPALKIYTSITPDAYHFATIEVNSQGTIQVVTRDDFTNPYPGDVTRHLGYLYYLEKPAAGSWSTPVRITSGKTPDLWSGWREEMILDSKDNLYLVYAEQVDNTERDVYLMMYDQASLTWKTDDQLTSTPHREGSAQIAMDSMHNLHVTYTNYTEGDIHYLKGSLPPPVGGEWVPINTVQVLVQIVGSAIAVSAIVAAMFVGFKRIKKRQN